MEHDIIDNVIRMTYTSLFMTYGFIRRTVSSNNISKKRLEIYPNKALKNSDFDLSKRN